MLVISGAFSAAGGAELWLGLLATDFK
jgi:hypothetical protein